MNLVCALEQGQELVRMGWCQFHAAKGVRGQAVWPHSEAAVQFCTTGAVIRVTWPWDEEDSTELHHLTQDCYDLLAQAIKEDGWEDDRPPWHVIADWNDAPGRTKEDVVALYDAAIELAKGGNRG
jgi:hypothetical protein